MASTASARRTITALTALAAVVVLAVVGYLIVRGDGTSGTAETARTTSRSTSTSPSPSPSGTSPASTSTTDGSTVTGDSSPDPEIDITAQPDEPQSAAERAAGIRAADQEAAAVSVSVPSVGLTTTISPQGLRDGKVNPLAQQVIWFTGYDRTRPGAPGTSVVAGHVVSGGGPDKFAPLEYVKEGDGVVLTYPGGEELRLEIVRTDIVAKTDLQTDQDVWGANDSTRRVVLVTCDDRLGFREDGHREANFVAVAEIAD